jgi:hypothetical protein
VWSYNQFGLAYNGFLRESEKTLKRITRPEAVFLLAKMPARNWAEAQMRLCGVAPYLDGCVEQLRRMAAHGGVSLLASSPPFFADVFFFLHCRLPPDWSKSSSS